MGERDLARMIELAATRPDDALHMADLPWRLCSPSAHMPERTRLWETADGRLLGWAVLQFPWHCLDFVVSPDGEQGGVPAAILAWATEHLAAEAARRDQPLPFYVGAREGDDQRIALVERHGFMRDDWSYIHLARDLHESVPPPSVPAGYTIRPLAGEVEVEAYVALHRAAFGSTNMTVAWRATTLRDPRYTPDLDLVAVAPDGALAGFCVTWLTSPLHSAQGRRVAQIEPLGVLPAHQRRGLARALLLTALARARAHGAARIEVDAEGDNDPARQVYSGVGFQPAYAAPFFRRRFGEDHAATRNC
jgi:ribosomal protein S18 acetylase RimI-like enzyme